MISLRRDFSLALGAAILIALAAQLAFCVLAWTLGFSLSSAWTVFGALAFLVAWRLGLRSLGIYSPRRFAIGVVSTGLIFLSGLAGGTRVLDWGGDSRTDHWLAVYNLKAGWNPIRDSQFQQFNARAESKLDSRAEGDQDYIGYASKGGYYFGALYAGFLGNPESGKAVNLLVLWAGLLLAFGVCASLAAPSWVQLVSTLAIGLSPTQLFQLSTLYVDQYVAGFFTSAALLGWLVFSRPYQNRFTFAALASALILLISAKQNALIYACLLSFFFLLVHWRARERKPIAVHLSALFVGTLLVGFNPYVTNTVFHGSPFYPVGDTAATEEIIAVVRPSFYRNHSKLTNLFQSSLSRLTTGTEIEWKIPFTFSNAELKVLAEPDLRVGGFGPLFSGPFLLAILWLPLFLVGAFKTNRPSLALFAAVLVSSAMMPEVYWARWVPQIYFLVAWILIFAAVQGGPFFGRIAKVALSILVLNSVLIAAGNLSTNYRRSAEYHRALGAFPIRPEPYRTYFAGSHLDQWRLIARGRNVEAISAEDLARCPEVQEIYRMASAKICRP